MADDKVLFGLELDPSSAQGVRRALSASVKDLDLSLSNKSLENIGQQIKRSSGQIKLDIDQNGINRLQELRNSAASVVDAFNKAQEASKRSAQALNEHKQATQAAAEATQSFGFRLGFTSARLAAYVLPATAFFQLSNAINVASKQVVEFDSSINKLSQVLDGNTEKARELTNEALKISAAYGQVGTDVLKTTAILAQSQDKFKNPQQILGALNQLSKTQLTVGFGDLPESAKGLVTTLRQFNLAGNDTAAVLDDLTVASTKFALSTDDIFDALKSGGASFAQAKGNFKEFIALVGGLKQKTDLPASEIGAEINRIVEKSIQPGVLAFTDTLTGNKIKDADGNLKGVLDRFKEIAVATAGFSAEKLAPVLKELSDREGGRILIPLLTDLRKTQEEGGKVAETFNALNNSQGALNKNSSIGLNQISTQIASIGERFSQVFAKIAQDQGIKDLVKNFADLAKHLADVLEVAAPLLPILIKFGAIKLGAELIQNAPVIAQGAKRFVNNATNRILGSASGVDSLLIDGQIDREQKAAERLIVSAGRRTSRDIQNSLHSLSDFNQDDPIKKTIGVGSVVTGKKLRELLGGSADISNLLDQGAIEFGPQFGRKRIRGSSTLPTDPVGDAKFRILKKLTASSPLQISNEELNEEMNSRAKAIRNNIQQDSSGRFVSTSTLSFTNPNLRSAQLREKLGFPTEFQGENPLIAGRVSRLTTDTESFNAQVTKNLLSNPELSDLNAKSALIEREAAYNARQQIEALGKYTTRVRQRTDDLNALTTSNSGGITPELKRQAILDVAQQDIFIKEQARIQATNRFGSRPLTQEEIISSANSSQLSSAVLGAQRQFSRQSNGTISDQTAIQNARNIAAIEAGLTPEGRFARNRQGIVGLGLPVPKSLFGLDETIGPKQIIRESDLFTPRGLNDNPLGNILNRGQELQSRNDRLGKSLIALQNVSNPTLDQQADIFAKNNALNQGLRLERNLPINNEQSVISKQITQELIKNGQIRDLNALPKDVQAAQGPRLERINELNKALSANSKSQEEIVSENQRLRASIRQTRESLQKEGKNNEEVASAVKDETQQIIQNNKAAKDLIRAREELALKLEEESTSLRIPQGRLTPTSSLKNDIVNLGTSFKEGTANFGRSIKDFVSRNKVGLTTFAAGAILDEAGNQINQPNSLLNSSGALRSDFANRRFSNQSNSLIGGGLSGAGAGAVFGSIIGPEGTAAGAVVGGVGGAVLGAASSFLSGESSDKDQIDQALANAKTFEQSVRPLSEALKANSGFTIDIGKQGTSFSKDSTSIVASGNGFSNFQSLAAAKIIADTNKRIDAGQEKGDAQADAENDIRTKLIESGISRNTANEYVASISIAYGDEIEDSIKKHKEVNEVQDKLKDSLGQYQRGLIQFGADFALNTQQIKRGSLNQNATTGITNQLFDVGLGKSNLFQLGGDFTSSLSENLDLAIRDKGTDRKLISQALGTFSSGAFSPQETENLSDIGLLQNSFRNINKDIIGRFAGTELNSVNKGQLTEVIPDIIDKVLAGNKVDVKTDVGLSALTEAKTAIVEAAKNNPEALNRDPEGFIAEALKGFNFKPEVFNRLSAVVESFNSEITKTLAPLIRFRETQEKINSNNAQIGSQRLSLASRGTQIGENNLFTLDEVETLANKISPSTLGGGALTSATQRLSAATGGIGRLRDLGAIDQNGNITSGGLGRRDEVTKALSEQISAQTDLSRTTEEANRALNIFQTIVQKTGEELNKISGTEKNLATTPESQILEAQRQSAIGQSIFGGALSDIFSKGITNEGEIAKDPRAFQQAFSGFANIPATTIKNITDSLGLLGNLQVPNAPRGVTFTGEADLIRRGVGQARANQISPGQGDRDASLAGQQNDAFNDATALLGALPSSLELLNKSITTLNATLNQPTTGTQNIVQNINLKADVNITGAGSSDRETRIQAVAVGVVQQCINELDKSSPTEADLAKKFQDGLSKFQFNQSKPTTQPASTGGPAFFGIPAN